MSRDYTLPDYKNCIANLANSVLKRFEVKPVGDTLPMADEVLSLGHRNVVVFLLDGMGISVLEKNLDKNGFLRSHIVGKYDSVFPPTTVAATTSILSGLEPCGHSLPGWDCYFPQIDKTVSIFPNTIQDTDMPAADYDVSDRFCHYESVIEKIKRSGTEAYYASSFSPPYPPTLDDICARITDLCAQPGQKYIYAYYNEPDTTMHRTGTGSQETVTVLRSLEQKIKALSENLDDTLLIITADHSHVDVKGVDINDYPTITECLVRMPSFEPRALNFHVKEDKKEQFESEFTKCFADKYLLWPMQKALDEKLFGHGPEHDSFRDMLGQYIALAVDDTAIFRSARDAQRYKGHHAGLTEKERIIPFIAVECGCCSDRK